MIIIVWLIVLTVCLFSVSVIWQGIRDPLFYWMERRSCFFDSLDIYSNLCYYNNKSPNVSFSWSLTLPWYYLDLEYTPDTDLVWPYYVNHPIVKMRTWVFGWFVLDISRVVHS